MLFFDGLEGDPALTAFPCPGCAAPIPLDAWRFAASARSGDHVTDAEVAAFGLVRGPPGPFRSTRAAEGLPAHVGEVPCPVCGRAALVALGLGEFQPARWMGALAGVR